MECCWATFLELDRQEATIAEIRILKKKRKDDFCGESHNMPAADNTYA
jgi:hypothetical protein